MNNELLDDRSSDSELPSSLLLEIKPMGKWLLITATVSLLIGLILMLVSFLGILLDGLVGLRLLFSLLFLLIGIVLLFFGTAQFRQLRTIHWLEENAVSYQLDKLFQSNFQLWKWAAIFLGVSLVTFIFILCTPSYVI